MLLLSVQLYGQDLVIDTVRLGDLELVVGVTGWGYVLRYDRFEKLGEYISLTNRQLVYREDQWGYCQETLRSVESQVGELERQLVIEGKRSVMYRDMYNDLHRDFLKQGDLMDRQREMLYSAGRGKFWRGIGVGVGGGVAIGLILGLIFN